MFSKSYAAGRDFARQYLVSQHIVRMGGLFDPIEGCIQ
jgi:hypothetical protein